jgi:hypothetical protein
MHDLTIVPKSRLNFVESVFILSLPEMSFGLPCPLMHPILNAALCMNPTFPPRSPTISHVRQPLDDVFALRNAHNRHTRNLPDPPLQIAIVGRYKVYPVLQHPLHNTIISIRALMIALQTLPALVPRNPQRNPIFRSQFLQLGHDAGGDDGGGFGVQQVHEGLVELELGVHRVREEVGVDEDGVGRAQGGVGLEEERGADLGHFALGEF